jgi:hypothetical protein
METYEKIRQELINCSVRLNQLAQENPSPEKDKVICEMQRDLLKAIRLTCEGEKCTAQF